MCSQEVLGSELMELIHCCGWLSSQKVEDFIVHIVQFRVVWLHGNRP